MSLCVGACVRGLYLTCARIYLEATYLAPMHTRSTCKVSIETLVIWCIQSTCSSLFISPFETRPLARDYFVFKKRKEMFTKINIFNVREKKVFQMQSTLFKDGSVISTTHLHSNRRRFKINVETRGIGDGCSTDLFQCFCLKKCIKKKTCLPLSWKTTFS